MSRSGGRQAPTAPPYAGGAPGGWSANSSSYNDTWASKLRTRLGLGAAAAGTGLCHLVFVGHSFDLGYNGVGLTQDTSKSWVTQFCNELSSLYNNAPVLDGIVPGTGMDDTWTDTGGTDHTSVPAYRWLNGVSTTQRVLTHCTDVWVGVPNSGVAVINWTIDGVAQAAINVTAAGTMQVVHVGGLADAPHTVKFTGAGGNSAFIGWVAGTGATTGIVKHVLSLGGTNAAFGTQYTNWSDHTSVLSLSPSRIGALTTLGITPNALFVDLFGNDALHGTGAPAASAGFDDILAQPPFAGGIDLGIINTYNITPVGATAYAPYQAALYAQATKRNARLFDVADIVGGNANTAITAGALGPDQIHPGYPLQAIFGRENGLAYAA